MPKYVDESGNEIEVQMPIDQLQAAAEVKAKLEAELEQTKQRLAGMENKDFNFRKLRSMSEEEMKKLSAREIELMKRQEDLEEKQRDFETRQIESSKREALRGYGIMDPETEAKVLANYDRIRDEAKTPEEVAAKMRDAVGMTSGASIQARPNPLYSPYGMGLPPSGQRQKAEISGELASFAKKMGISDEDIKKYGNK